MLWPAYSDCLFAIVQASVLTQMEEQLNPAEASPIVLNESVAQHWLHVGMRSALSSMEAEGRDMTAETCNQIISILLNLARQGPKSRTRAKMLLTDFAKIKKGEMTADSLVSYTLP